MRRCAALSSYWLGTGYLLVDAGRWTVGVRVASYVIYALMTVLAVQTL